MLVEIGSPSSRRADWVVKKTLYERTGVPSYWIVDPDGPRLTAWKLVDGRYEQVADVGPTQTWDATEPFPMTIAPGTLLSR